MSSAGRPAKQAGGRAGVRPGAAIAARAAPTSAAVRPTRTRRVMALAVVAVVLAVLLAPAMRSYVAQRERISSLSAQVAIQRRQVTELERVRAAWDDPAYVKAQARERLRYVMPGDRVYTVIDPAPAPTGRRLGGTRAERPVVPAGTSWFGAVWRSSVLAGTR